MGHFGYKRDDLLGFEGWLRNQANQSRNVFSFFLWNYKAGFESTFLTTRPPLASAILNVPCGCCLYVWYGSLFVSLSLPCVMKQPGPVCYPGQANRFWARVGWPSSLWMAAWCGGSIWGTGRGKGSAVSNWEVQLERRRRWGIKLWKRPPVLNLMRSGSPKEESIQRSLNALKPQVFSGVCGVVNPRLASKRQPRLLLVGYWLWKGEMLSWAAFCIGLAGPASVPSFQL